MGGTPAAAYVSIPSSRKANGRTSGRSDPPHPIFLRGRLSVVGARRPRYPRVPAFARAGRSVFGVWRRWGPSAGEKPQVRGYKRKDRGESPGARGSASPRLRETHSPSPSLRSPRSRGPRPAFPPLPSSSFRFGGRCWGCGERAGAGACEAAGRGCCGCAGERGVPRAGSFPSDPGPARDKRF